MKDSTRHLLLFLIPVCLLVVPATKPGYGEGDSEVGSAPKLINNVWVDTPLSQVLRDISMEIQVTIAVDPSVKDSLVSLEADGMPLEECLDKIVVGQGLVVRKMDDRFFLVGSGRPGSPTFEYLAQHKGISLKYIDTKHLMKILPRDLQPFVSTGDRTTDALIYAPPDKTDKIMNILGTIDVPRRQVVLEVLVAEVLKENGSSLGIDWEATSDHTNLSLANGTDIITGIGKYTSVGQQDFWTLMLTLRAMVSDGKATIRSRPRVATLNGEPASIDISLEEYFNIVTDINGGLLRTELQVVKSGVLLEMTPQVGANGDITVNVSTEVSDVAAESSKVSNNKGDPSSGGLPIIRRRKADTTVLIKEGDAIVIGGLIESVERSHNRRVPVLGSIPLVGLFFRKTSKEMSEKEVVIFITPHILPDSVASTATGGGVLLDLDKEAESLKNVEKSNPDSPSDKK